MPEFDQSYPLHVDTLRQRHDEALAAAGHDGVAIHSGQEIYRFLDDNPYPFAANPHFLWWAPLTSVPQSWILYRPGERPRLIYFQPEDYWHLPPSDPQGYWTDAFEIEVIREPDQVRDLLPAQRQRWAFIGEHESLGNELGFGAVNPGPLMDQLHYRRGIKTAYEIQCMEAASTRAVRAHAAAAETFRNGGSELDIHLAYLAAADHAEAELPYTNIVALGRHGAVLHYHGLDRVPPSPPLSFLIDAGARHNGYAVDITRTWSARNDEFQDLILALDIHQQQLCADCVAGADFRELHLAAHRHVAQVLIDFDLARADVAQLVDDGVTATFFPHGLGHLLGLQVHDVGGFQAGPDGGTIDKPAGHPYLRLTRTLAPGMVTTIEPGLYFIDSLLEKLRRQPAGRVVDWARVEMLQPFGGIRIEDDVLVTADKPRNLTREAFATL